jgi:1,4-dihydroxy-2-naphthoate octaprenyltransferase
MQQIKLWLLAARPKTLFAVISPVLVGSVIAFKEGQFNPYIFFLTLVTGLGIQISTNLWNDYFDFLKGADTKERKGPMRITQSGLVSLATMKQACIISLVITAILGVPLLITGGIFIGLLLAISLLLTIGYTAGPVPLAYRGLGDLFVFVFFGPIACLSTYYLQAHTFNFSCNIIGLALGALSTAILAVNNIRDIDEDKRSGKKTLTVRFGIVFGKVEYVLLLVIPSVVVLSLSPSRPFILLSLIYLIPAWNVTKKVLFSNDATELNKSLARTGATLFLFTALFCISWLIS